MFLYWIRHLHNICDFPCAEEYRELCPHEGYAPVGPEQFEDINECKLYPGICGEGQCINMDGSYRCECHDGFLLDLEGMVCIGEY